MHIKRRYPWQSKQKMRIEWTAFKLSGKKVESKFGDIALLTKLNYQDGDTLEGVAFLEAKKRNRNKTTFGAIRTNQLKRIRKNAPSSVALLYDYTDITDFADTGIFKNTRQWLIRKPCTCSVIVPIRTVLHVGKKDMSLYKFSIPFSYQLLFRYFQGFDLEFGEMPINAAKGYYSAKFGAPTYLVIVSVGFGKAEPVTDIDFNRDLFRKME
jgi:hypothetical protein